MTDQELFKTIIEAGLNIVFLILYLNERARARDLQEKRVQENREWSERFFNYALGRPITPTKPPTDPKLNKFTPP